MVRQVTEYELLISCPSDVQDELKIINDIVETFNHLFGIANNARIITKHWSKDAYPQSGGKPQKILNEQFVFRCDAAVAVFWTRFGTPTDEYSSGTEEEIEELLKSGKQVFLYFSDCLMNPSLINNEQYEKVKAFRARYKDRGLYWVYSDLETFRKDFLNHLTLYFVNLLGGSENQRETAFRSNLLIKGVSDGKPFDSAISFQTYYSKCKYIQELNEKVISLINQVNDIILTQETPTENIEKIIEADNDEDDFPNLTVGELIKLPKTDLSKLSERFVGLKEMFPLKQVTISESIRDTINKFVSENNIDLNADFYHLGNLSKSNYLVGFGTEEYNGNDEEKEKYKLICKISNILDEYYSLIDYFSEIDKKYFINLSLSNFGTDYDEDIDVRLYIKKGYLCLPGNLPFPGFDCIDISIKILDYVYKAQKTVYIDEYPDYYIKPSFHRVSPAIPFKYFGGKSYEEEMKEKNDNFNDKKNEIFCYQTFSDDEHDIVRYNQKYLKQNTNSFLPSYLVFDNLPEKIKYEITSRRFPDVVEGELLIRIDKE